MLTFKRALLIAAALVTCFLILRSSHSTSKSDPLKIHNSPKPTGSHADNRKIVEQPPDSTTNRIIEQAKAPTTATTSTSTVQQQQQQPYKGDSGGRIALSKKPRPQIALDDLKLTPLRQQLAYSFPYDPEGKFPAYIWQTWKVTPSSGDFYEAWRPAEASWTELHPTFVHEVITDSVAVHLIKHFYASVPEVIRAYNALPEPVLKADFFRYLILLARGGIYSDIDTTALKSAVEWVPAEVPRSTYGLVVGIEADPDRPDWHDWYSRRIQFCQWTIQAKSGHPVLVDVVATITEETLRRQKAGELDMAHMDSVVEFTGPGLWTDAIFKFFNNPEYFDMSTSKGNITWQQFTGITQAKKVGDVVVLPITSFSPGVGQMEAGDIDDPMAFVHHTFEGEL